MPLVGDFHSKKHNNNSNESDNGNHVDNGNNKKYSPEDVSGDNQAYNTQQTQMLGFYHFGGDDHHRSVVHGRWLW